MLQFTCGWNSFARCPAMTKPIIEVHDLSKQYRLGVIGATTLRDSFDRLWQRLRRNGSSPFGRQKAERGNSEFRRWSRIPVT